MMTAYATIERAVQAMRQAYDFVTKPFRRAQIERVVKDLPRKAKFNRREQSTEERNLQM